MDSEAVSFAREELVCALNELTAPASVILWFASPPVPTHGGRAQASERLSPFLALLKLLDSRPNAHPTSRVGQADDRVKLEVKNRL